MQGEHSLECPRLSREYPHHSLPERIVPFETEHKPRHQSRAACQISVRDLIGIEPSGDEAFRQEDCLTEREAESLASNRVYPARSIADEGRSIPIHVLQFSCCRDCTPLYRCPLQAFEAASNRWEFLESRVKPQSRVPRNCCHTDFVGCNRSDI
jgi:hypothetical protein